jgi:hypothetical protein
MHKVGYLTAGAIGVMLLVPFASQAKAPMPASHPAAAVAAAPQSVVINAVPAPTATISLPARTRNLSPKVVWTVTTPSGSPINGYFLSETNTDPLVGDPGWVPTKPANFTFPAGDGTRTLYAWVKDHNNKVSVSAHDSTQLDTTAPLATISAPATTTTRAVPVTITGNDSGGTGVTAWALVAGTTAPIASDTAWKSTKPTSYTMPLGNVARTISAFARDAVGNVSAPATTTVTLGLPAPTVSVTMAALVRKLSPAITVNTTDPGGTGIASYYLSQSSTAPLANNPSWNINKPTSFTFTAGDGTRTLYIWVKDRNGSVSAGNSASTVIDMTAPTVSLTAPASSTTRGISVTITGSDATSGITRWALVAGTTAPGANDPAWVASPPTTFTLSTGFGAKSISAFSRDAAGNVSAASTQSVIHSPPLPTMTIGLPASTRTLSVKVTINTTDPGGSGIAAYILSSSSTVPTVGSASWKVNKPTTFTLPSVDGSKTVYAWVKDNNNKISLTASASTLLDQTAPTVTLTAPTTSTSRNISITVTGTDVGGSGVTNYAVVAGTTAPLVTDTAWKSVPVTTWQLPLGNGAKTISAFTRDAAGNVSLAGTKVITMTLAAPTVTISLPAYTKVAAVPVTLNATDTSGTNITGYYLSESPTAPTIGGSTWINKPTTFTLSATDATKTVRAWVKDGNGDISAVATASTMLDTTAPVAATFTLPSTTSTRNPTFTMTGTDAGSGIAYYAVVATSTAPSSGDSAWKVSAPTTYQLSTGNGVKTLYAFVRDAAGNVSAANTKSTTMTLPAPSVATFGFTVAGPINFRNPGLSVTTNDPGGSGISGSAGYYVSESATPAPTAASAGWKPAPSITLSAGDGTKTVYLWVKDNNGTVSTTAASASIVVDTVAPTTTLAALTYAGSTTVSVTIGGADTGGTGIVMWAVVEGISPPTYGDPNWVSSVPTSIIVADSSGVHTVTAFARDAAGNVSAYIINVNSRTVTLP